MADDVFECVNFVKGIYPDNMAEWPDNERRSAFAARDRLLKQEPSLTVLEERSYCIGPGDDRWPDPLPENLRINGFTNALIYEVKLSSPIEEFSEVKE